MSARTPSACAVCWWLSLVAYSAVAVAATALMVLSIIDIARRLA